MSVLGIDIGRVIADSAPRGQDTNFFSSDPNLTAAVPGAFESIGQLVKTFGRDRVYLVSKCGERTQRRTLLWFQFHDFFYKTGVDSARIHFVRKRWEKAPICERLGVTHFVDDRLEVLGYLTSVKTRILFRPDPQEVKEHKEHLPLVIPVQSWAEAMTVILESLHAA